MADDYAVWRHDYDPESGMEGLEDWMTRELQTNPNYQLPEGYELKNGRVSRRQPPFLLRHPWLIPLMGVGAGLGGAAAAGTGPFAGGGTVAADVAGTAAATNAATGPIAAGGAATGAGRAAAGMGADTLRDTLTRAGVAAGLTGLGQAFGPDQPEIPQELRDILALQKQRMEAQSPLYASILQLAQSRLPTSVQGAQLPGSGASLPQQQAVEQLARRR